MPQPLRNQNQAGARHIAMQTTRIPSKVPVLLALTLLAAACGAGTTRGVETVDVDGVWVFTHDESGGEDALHGGVATVVDRCLYVGDAVVVWRSDQLGQAQQLIASVRAGDQPRVMLPGGGVALVEDPAADVSAVTDLCPARVVWYTRPGP